MPSRALLAALATVAAACAAAAAGLEVCAKRSRSDDVVTVAGSLAAEHRAIVADVEQVALALGAPRRERPRTSERLRWEWLASTGSVLDGAPEGRLLAEIGRVTSEGGGAAKVAERALGSALVDRVRAVEQAVARFGATLPNV